MHCPERMVKREHAMNLFHQLCKESGEILRLIVKPVNQPVSQTVHKQTTTSQEQVNETMIVRRTVIEEIEIHRAPAKH